MFRTRTLQLAALILLLLGAGALASLPSPEPGRVLFLVCGPHRDGPRPLFSPETRLVRVEGEAVDPLSGFELVSPPHVSYDGTGILFSARTASERFAQVWEVDREGNLVAQRTRGEAHSVTPDYLPDGRIVFARLEGESFAEASRSALYVMDEAGKEETRISFGESLDLVDHVLPDGRILLRRWTEAAGKGTELALRPDGTELARFLPDPPDEPAAVLARESEAAGFLPGQTVDVNGLERLEIKSVIRLEARTRPPVATSVVDERMDRGWLLCLDARRSDLGLDLEKAHTARIVDAVDGTPLAEVAIEADGSFYVQVPADLLIQVEILDEQGGTLVRQSEGIWVRPNEQRGCIGCHEPRYAAPRNRVPLALQKTPSGSGAEEFLTRRFEQEER